MFSRSTFNAAMPAEFYASCLALACALLFTYMVAVAKSRCKASPPGVSWLPFIGSTISLALHGAGFVHWCRQKHGDIFKVTLGGHCMTYLLSPEAMKLFFSAPDDQIAFRQARNRALHKQSLRVAITPILSAPCSLASRSQSTADTCANASARA